MVAALSSWLAVASLVIGTAPEHSYGYLRSSPLHTTDTEVMTPYLPHEGDLIFFDDQSVLWGKLYKLGGTAPPFHVGIVVKKSNGTVAILESGPDDTLHVYILEAARRLHTFKGILQVRQAKVALSPEQSADLTKFARNQEGKRYAVWRLLLQGTPLRTRGKYSSQLFGDTYMNRSRWLCAEIVCSAASLVGLFDGKVIKGTDTYPLDIVDDHLYDLSAVYTPAAYWTAEP